jgi:DNA-binding XRE family transcriptional regulator
VLGFRVGGQRIHWPFWIQICWQVTAEFAGHFVLEFTGNERRNYAPVPEDSYLAVVRARIKAARIARGLRQDDAAELAGIEPRSYQRLEAANAQRKFNPTLETLRAIAGVLGVTVAELTAEPTVEELRAVGTVGKQPRVRL